MKAWISAVVALLSGPASAASCQDITHEGVGFAVCKAKAGEDLRLWLSAPDGKPVATFERLRRMAEDKGGQIVFAMNAGMFHSDRRPVGLYIEDWRSVTPLVVAKGPGNFGMRPNGVFCIGEAGFAVIESRKFSETRPSCRYATQSGPMLVIDGVLHPKFVEGSDSLNIRNGVGVSSDGETAWFAISDVPINFFDFASFFRDRLGTPQALYLDGSISRLYAPDLGREDIGFPMGPIVGLVVPSG